MVADDWIYLINKRAGYNPEIIRLLANTTGAETTEQIYTLIIYQMDLN